MKKKLLNRSQQRLLMIIIKHIEQVFQVHMERQDIQNPSVTVSSWSANKMKFKGTCKLTAGGTYTMTGTKTISLP